MYFYLRLVGFTASSSFIFTLIPILKPLSCTIFFSFDALGRPTVTTVVIIVFAHVVRPSVSTFQKT